MISIVIPTYNEESCLEQVLADAYRLRQEASLEIIVADGGSTDNTVAIARRHARVVSSAKGKAIQLNAGAREATGDILFFVHADMRLPEGTLQRIHESIHKVNYDGGGFSNQFSRHNRKIKLLGRIIQLEFRNKEDNSLNTLFFGDNGIFVKTSVYRTLGGFEPLPIMEDYDFSRRLSEKFRSVRILEPKLIVSPRRLVKAGFLKTIGNGSSFKSFSEWGSVPRHWRSGMQISDDCAWVYGQGVPPHNGFQLRRGR